MMDMMIYGLLASFLSCSIFAAGIALIFVVMNLPAYWRRRRARREQRRCWMCERRTARPGGAECKRCRKVYEQATTERIAA